MKSLTGFPILAAAIQSRQQACLRLLLEHSCDVTQQIEGWLLLHFCSYHDVDLNVLERILDCGVDIDFTTLHKNWTALILATQEYQDLVCDYLVSWEADINKSDIDGETVFHFAINHQNHRMLRLLSQYHANYYIQICVDKTLFHKAA